MLETVEEMLESIKWLKVLGYSNQFTIHRELVQDKAERDRVLEAATRAVDQDADLRRWKDKLAKVRREAVRIQEETGVAFDASQADETHAEGLVHSAAELTPAVADDTQAQSVEASKPKVQKPTAPKPKKPTAKASKIQPARAASARKKPGRRGGSRTGSGDDAAGRSADA